MNNEKRNITTKLETESKYLTNILDKQDVKEFKKLIPELQDTWMKKQMFRTETEMRFSVLSDNKYPTKAAKYWQSVREQNTHFENLVHLSFEARKNDVEIKKLKRDIKKEFDDGKFDKENVNTHQADSYMLRLQHQKDTLTPGSSQPEVFNVLGQLHTLERVRKSGELLNGTKRERLTKK